MPENMMNSAQKANSKEFGINYDRIFRPVKTFTMETDCPKEGCLECKFIKPCNEYLNKKYDLHLGVNDAK